MSSEYINTSSLLRDDESNDKENTTIAIRVRDLSKRYEIYDKPRDRLKQFLIPPLQSMTGKKCAQYFHEFWALKDISFDIKKGETIGIIGKNGSGKSTLLQTICGTLTPTVGTVETSGRIAALLELGSGFNPEFTGRENVYMNAAILGLSKEEIDARFDNIAAFADIGDFIDRTVKQYSSGMYVRLAFSVIAHVEADILIVDEALSVGDASFTQKCMRFIRSFQERSTLIFVSHDTNAVQNLCKTSIWLENGKIRKIGVSKKIVESYLQESLQEVYGKTVKLSNILSAADPPHVVTNIPKGEKLDSSVISYDSVMLVQDNLTGATGWKTGVAEIMSATLEKLDSSQSADTTFTGGEMVCMFVRAKAHDILVNPVLGFLVRDRLGQDLFGENTLSYTAMKPCSIKHGQEFTGKFFFKLPMLPNGQYAVMVSVADGDLNNNVQHHWLHDALIINVSSSKVRYGLVGIAFDNIVLEVHDEQ